MFSDSGNVPFRSVFSVTVSSESLLRVNDEFFARECVDTRIEHGCPSQNRRPVLNVSVSIIRHARGSSVHANENLAPLMAFRGDLGSVLW
jgi:hypothetical protein